MQTFFQNNFNAIRPNEPLKPYHIDRKNLLSGLLQFFSSDLSEFHVNCIVDYLEMTLERKEKGVNSDRDPHPQFHYSPTWTSMSRDEAINICSKNDGSVMDLLSMKVRGQELFIKRKISVINKRSNSDKKSYQIFPSRFLVLYCYEVAPKLEVE